MTTPNDCPHAYLFLCGWTQRPSDYRKLLQDSRAGFCWIDPITGESYRDESTDRAVAKQVERDRARAAFVATYKV